MIIKKVCWNAKLNGLAVKCSLSKEQVSEKIDKRQKTCRCLPTTVSLHLYFVDVDSISSHNRHSEWRAPHLIWSHNTMFTQSVTVPSQREWLSFSHFIVFLYLLTIFHSPVRQSIFDPSTSVKFWICFLSFRLLIFGWNNNMRELSAFFFGPKLEFCNCSLLSYTILPSFQLFPSHQLPV